MGYFVTDFFFGETLLPSFSIPSWRATTCQLFATNWIYSHLPLYLEAVSSVRNLSFCHTVLAESLSRWKRHKMYYIKIPLCWITKYIDLGGCSILRHVLMGPLLAPHMTGCHCIHVLLHGYFRWSFPYFRILLSFYECCHLVMLYCMRAVHKGFTFVVITCEEISRHSKVSRVTEQG